MLKNINRMVYACGIAYQALIDVGLKLPHQELGVVIGPGVRIGKNCTLFSNVVLGDKHGVHCNGYPTLGSNVVVGAGAVILGCITIGDNAIIGANSVVLSDVPYNATVVGNPAIIVKIEGNKQ